MSKLINFLKLFSPKTIERSASYVSRIDRQTIDIVIEDEELFMYAQIEGTDYYDTNIIYDLKTGILIDDDCSCPVGYHCKHAAALARLFFKEYREKVHTQLNSEYLLQSGLQPQSSQMTQAKKWLNEFKRCLLDVHNQEIITPTTNCLIYYLDQSFSKLTIEVKKGRLNQNGTVGSLKPYREYNNILTKKLTLPDDQRKLFSQLYAYSQSNKMDYFYQSYLDITGISFTSFEHLIHSKRVYWKKTIDRPLQWSDKVYQIDLSWQKNIVTKTEKLKVAFCHTDQFYHLDIYTNLSILATMPLCYIDISTNEVGYLETTLSFELLTAFQKMPEMSVELMHDFEKIVAQSDLLKNLPKPNFIQEIQTVGGSPQPILRFGTTNQLNHRLNNHSQTFAEIEFRYSSGAANLTSTDHYFIGEIQGHPVRQERNLLQEQQALQRLEKALPSLTWIKDLSSQQRQPVHVETDSLVAAEFKEWSSQLFPVNQFEKIGWKVEHTQNSPLNLEYVDHIELYMRDSENHNGWFEIGTKIQDKQGREYDLLDIISMIMKRYPDLLDPEKFRYLDDDRIFMIPALLGKHPDFAMQVKDIKPIILNLYSLLDQGERKIDHYDAQHFLDIQDDLGGRFEWKMPDHLHKMIEEMKKGPQQILGTPDGFRGQLRPYQQEGVAWLQFLRAIGHGGILADDMGLGKTAQTLAHLLLEKQAGYLKQKPTLIVAPSSLVHNWFKEVHKFTPDLKVLILQGAERHDFFQEIQSHDVVITSYSLVVRDQEKLSQYEFHQLILDEAQYIKNPRAKAAQVVRALSADHRLCLTGTPIENHLGELWALFHFLMPGFLYSQEAFNRQYRYPIEKHGKSYLKEKLVARVKPFILRRLKTQVEQELPAKTVIDVNINMSLQQSKLYEAVRATMQKNIIQIVEEKGLKKSQIHILDALLKLRQVCCHPSLLNGENFKKEEAGSAKLDYLIEMVHTMVGEGRKILIFSQFTTMLCLIEQQLKKIAIDYVKLTGQTKKRQEVVEKFQHGQVPIFLISLKAGGVGLNLTAADTVIHYDPWWNPATENQASDRAWRIGQNKPVFVYKLITNQSIEQKIIDLQKDKSALIESILTSGLEGEAKISQDDIMKLFEKL